MSEQAKALNPSRVSPQEVSISKKKLFEQHYACFHTHFKGLALRYLKDSELAEDAVQEVFIKFWLSADRWDQRGNLKAYLFTTFKNHLSNLLKSNSLKILRQFENHDEQLQSPNGTQDVVDLQTYSSRLQEGISRLSKKKKEIFLLKVYENLSNEEIAQREGVSVNTVKCHFQHASKFIRNYLKNGSVLME